MDVSATLAALKEIIKTIAPNKTIPAEDVDLFAEGVLDSFATIEMVAALEDKFHVELPTEELTMENFQTLNSLAKLVDRHRQR